MGKPFGQFRPLNTFAAVHVQLNRACSRTCEDDTSYRRLWSRKKKHDSGALKAEPGSSVTIGHVGSLCCISSEP